MDVKISDLLPAAGIDGLPNRVEGDGVRVRAAVMRKLAAEAAPPGTGRRPRRLGRTLLAAAITAALLGVTACAAALGGFDWLRDTVGPAYIDAVDPVEQSVTDGGIRMTVIAAQKYGDMGVYYVAFTDTTGQGRITEDARPFFTRPLGIHETQLVYYDGAEPMAVYELRVDGPAAPADLVEADPTLGGNTIAVDSITYGERELETVRMDIDMAAAVAAGETAGEAYESPTRLPSGMLEGGHVANIPGTEAAYISAIGTNCGLVAVQIAALRGEFAYSLDAYLLTSDGRRIDPRPGAAGSRDGDIGAVELYFDADAGTLADCVLCVEGSERRAVRGNWTLDADMDVTGALVQTEVELDHARGAVLTLSPLGVSLCGDLDGAITSEHIVLETESGDISLGSRGTWLSDGSGTDRAFWTSDSVINVSSVTAIRIGNTRIALE